VADVISPQALHKINALHTSNIDVASLTLWEVIYGNTVSMRLYIGGWQTFFSSPSMIDLWLSRPTNHKTSGLMAQPLILPDALVSLSITGGWQWRLWGCARRVADFCNAHTDNLGNVVARGVAHWYK
jgi:hypothetical protein